MSRRLNDDSGWILISAIIMIIFLAAIGFSVSQLVSTQYQHTKQESFDQNTQLVAEAGIEQTVYELNSNDSFTGYSTPQAYFDNTTQGKGNFTTTVTTNADGTSKTIIATGKVYRNDSATSPYLVRKIKATVVGTASTGYSVSTGPGGLIMSGSASITNSNVYVDGTITMSGSSSIGTNQNPETVDVANIACPTGSDPGPTYPTLCIGTQPISMSGSPHIYGTVCATGQTSSTGISGGNGGSGLEAGCTAPSVSQPVYNRSSIISGMTTTASGISGTYNCSGSKTITLPANIELTGSNISWGNSCKIIVSGNVYIPGNLSLGGAVKVTLADSAGTTRPTIVVDGTINVGGSASIISNSSGTGMDFVTFANSTGDSGATPSGSNLYNSQKEININVNGAASTPGVIFDAYWSEVELSGSGHVGAAAGQTIYLNGAGTVIFGTTLSSGSKTWSITSYQPYFGP